MNNEVQPVAVRIVQGVYSYRPHKGARLHTVTRNDPACLLAPDEARRLVDLGIAAYMPIPATLDADDVTLDADDTQESLPDSELAEAALLSTERKSRKPKPTAQIPAL